MAKTIKDRMAELIPKWREDRKALMTGHRDAKISEVTVAQAIGGMRGIKGMVCDTSVVEPDKAVRLERLHKGNRFFVRESTRSHGVVEPDILDRSVLR